MIQMIQIIMVLTSLLMVVVPVSCTRKDCRDNPEAIKKTRTMGIWLMAAAVIWLISSKLI